MHLLPEIAKDYKNNYLLFFYPQIFPAAEPSGTL